MTLLGNYSGANYRQFELILSKIRYEIRCHQNDQNLVGLLFYSDKDTLLEKLDL